ncbi:MAG: hypothetical protein IJW18_06300 [Lachnospiraceae bacterium]|nr:hypothetical protein [Lachnospiraceae bacterium]
MGEKYISKDKREIPAGVAQKEYYKKLNIMLVEYKKLLLQLANVYETEKFEELYRGLNPARKVLVNPIFMPVECTIKEFESIVYEGKGFNKDDNTEYYTVKGERVRSKSEKIIADELYRYEIPYKYELPLELNATTYDRMNRIVIYPDFTVLNKRTGKRWIIEHLGMMDKSSYYESAIRKIDTYEKNNMLLGRDVLIFHESSASPLNTNVIKEYIEHYLT